MRACEADRCEAGATVNGRWCERHGVIDDVLRPVIVVDHQPPEYALEGHSEPDPVADAALERRRAEIIRNWPSVVKWIEDAELDLAEARAGRVSSMEAMRRTGMSLGDIAEVTGLTRQRIGQLLKESKQ